jgi:pSer/pThr/pTyr-binding forkhead associated (FHA) protein
MVSPPNIIVQLIHLEGPYKGQIQEFAQNEISIGRHQECKLRFPPDISIISRKHATIIREGNRFKLIDTSSNGTEVNGKMVKEAYLKDGDVLTIAPGGPKISFLTEIRKGAVPPEPTPPLKPRRQYTPPSEPQQQQHSPPTPPRPKPPPRPAPPPHQQPQPQKPKVFTRYPEDNVMVPLIIQFGPTLRSYKKLPVTIGKNPNCEFSLDRPGILDRHAEIFFYQDQYWVKDLTGQRLVKVNYRECEGGMSLQANDVVMLSPQGPSFQFLGGGRLAEMEQKPAQEDPELSQPQTAKPEHHESLSDKVLNKAKSIFRK